MIRLLSALTLISLAAATTPASAESVRVSLAGKDPATIRADIEKAAEAACREVVFISSLDSYVTCVRASVADAMAQVQNQTVAKAAPAPIRLSSK
ncbi:MAG TPA: hypothetical protein VL460_06580 [Caulobacteraceae bacterium]|jgi:hypothetical protein|nr:hypothetical protein [Caulobacteraceae bacterium]